MRISPIKFLPVLFFVISICVLGQAGTYVQLKDGTEIQAQSIKYKEPAFNDRYLLVNGQQKIDMSKVDHYQDASGYYICSKIDGYGKDVRLKRESEGEISIYSRIVTQYMYSQYGGTFSNKKVNYFKKGRGSVQILNYENLERHVRDNPESKAIMDKIKKSNSINMGAYLVGGALFLAGLAHTSELNREDGPPPYNNKDIKFSPFLFVGAAVLMVPLYTQPKKHLKLKEAIRVYNL